MYGTIAKKARLDNGEGREDGDGNDSFDEDDIQPTPSVYIMSQLPTTQAANAEVTSGKRHTTNPFDVDEDRPPPRNLTPRRRPTIREQIGAHHTSGQEILLTNQLHNEKRLREKAERDRNELLHQIAQKEKRLEQEKEHLKAAYNAELQLLKNKVTKLSLDRSNLTLSESQNLRPDDVVMNESMRSTTSPGNIIQTKKVVPKLNSAAPFPTPFGSKAQSGFKRPLQPDYQRRHSQTFVNVPSQPLNGAHYGGASTSGGPIDRVLQNLEKRKVVTCDAETSADVPLDYIQRHITCGYCDFGTIVTTAVCTTPSELFDSKKLCALLADKGKVTVGEVRRLKREKKLASGKKSKSRTGEKCEKTKRRTIGVGLDFG